MTPPPMKVKAHYSCRPGIEATPMRDQHRLRSGLKQIFACKSPSFFYDRVRDYVNIPYETKLRIDALFNEVAGLSPEEIWRVWYD